MRGLSTHDDSARGRIEREMREEENGAAGKAQGAAASARDGKPRGDDPRRVGLIEGGGWRLRVSSENWNGIGSGHTDQELFEDAE